MLLLLPLHTDIIEMSKDKRAWIYMRIIINVHLNVLISRNDK